MNRTVVIVWSGVTLAGSVLGLLAAARVASWMEIPPAPEAEPEIVASRSVVEAPQRAGGVDDYLEPIGALFEASATTAVVTRGRVDAELLVTTVAPQPVYSSALVVVEDTSQVVLVGDRLAGATVEEIRRGSVALRLDDGSTDLLVFGSRAPTGPQRPRREPGGRARIDWSEGITAVDDTHYEVTEDALRRALERLGDLGKLAKVVPNFVDGKVDGFRIFRIRDASPFGSLGLRDNDVLRSVNGQPLDPKTILSTVHALDGEATFALEVQRGAEIVQLQYEIQ
jgi:general secretion pathway protein C